jgi:hypothetical protein
MPALGSTEAPVHESAQTADRLCMSAWFFKFMALRVRRPSREATVELACHHHHWESVNGGGSVFG